MNKIYLYFTKARVALILTTLGSLVWLGFQINISDIWWETFINLALGVYISVVLGYLEADLITRPPEDLEQLDNLIEYKGEIVNIEEILGEIGCDAKGNVLGECTGVYFTKEFEYLMVGNHLYDQMGVYFKYDEEDD